MIFDEQGKPIDYRFLTVNEAFERQTGLTDAVGKTIRSLAPNHEDHWFETYGRIAVTGESERFEHPAAELGRYYEVYAFRVGEPEERRLGVLFNDIAKRKRAEEERELLARELSHRVKNTLAVVQALAHADRRPGAFARGLPPCLPRPAAGAGKGARPPARGADARRGPQDIWSSRRWRPTAIDHPEVVEIEGAPAML